MSDELRGRNDGPGGCVPWEEAEELRAEVARLRLLVEGLDQPLTTEAWIRELKQCSMAALVNRLQAVEHEFGLRLVVSTTDPRPVPLAVDDVPLTHTGPPYVSKRSDWQ